jgi:hypothetical protein
MIGGESIDLGWVAATDDLWVADQMLCQLMGFDVEKIPHLRYGLARGASTLSGDEIGALRSFEDDRFYLRRNLWNRMAKLTWYSTRLNHLVYFSKSSAMLHKLMYSVRRKPAELSAKGVDWT